MFANNAKYNALGIKFSSLTNFLTNATIIKKALGVATERSVPKLSNKTLNSWYQKRENIKTDKVVYLFSDEFTNLYDTEIGKDAIIVLEKLGYTPEIIKHAESGRSYISKGFLKQAKALALKNIEKLKPIVTKNIQIVGLIA